MLYFPPTQALEALLPARVKVDIPVGENVEEVNLTEYDKARDGSRGRGEAYHEDDDSDEQAGPRVQCAHQ